MTADLEYKVVPFDMTGLNAEGRTIEGYAATFGNMDRVKDVIHPGAFTKTLTERGNRIKFLWQHDQKEPIGKMIEMREDPRGLFVKAVISDTARGRDALALLKDGAIYEMSIGYQPMVSDFSKLGEETVRNLREIKLHEASLVTMPANEQAVVTALKAEPQEETEDKATWDTAYVNDLPDSAFLYVEDGDKDEGGRTVPRSKRHFPYKDSAGKVDLPHLRNAIARIPQSNAPGLDKEKLQERARRMLEDASKADAPDIETKVGRVLSAKNRELLTKCRNEMKEAHDALQALLDATDPETDEEPEEDAPIEEMSHSAPQEEKAGPVVTTPPPTLRDVTRALLELAMMEATNE